MYRLFYYVGLVLTSGKIVGDNFIARCEHNHHQNYQGDKPTVEEGMGRLRAEQACQRVGERPPEVAPGEVGTVDPPLSTLLGAFGQECFGRQVHPVLSYSGNEPERHKRRQGRHVSGQDGEGREQRPNEDKERPR